MSLKPSQLSRSLHLVVFYLLLARSLVRLLARAPQYLIQQDDEVLKHVITWTINQ